MEAFCRTLLWFRFIQVIMRTDRGISPEGNPEQGTGLPGRTFFLFTLLIGTLLVCSGVVFLRMEYNIIGDGIVHAQEEWHVYAPVSERLSEVNVTVGQHVQASNHLFQLDNMEINLEIIRRQEVLLKTRHELNELDTSIHISQLKPSDPQMAIAKERLSLLQEIKEIQTTMTESLANLSQQRAIRSLEYYRQQVENLRTHLDILQTSWWKQSIEGGLWELEQTALKSRKAHLQELCEHMEQEIQLLQQRRQGMTVTSPIDGIIAEIDYRHTGMVPAKGDRLAKIIQQDGRYRVRTWLDQRNYDLIRPGLPVRMESQVFNSTLEGYIIGRVIRSGPDANTTRSQQGEPLYEVWIEVLESPYPLLHGSSVKVHIQMGKVPIWRSLFKLPEQRRVSYTAPEQP